ncbi:NAD dependent epimerase/dehydratase [Aspergillus saccharolyticus JOP 1030-1]|uniref:NAD dependent epimerase/dehydratase n=1 Tax=Aspergillus saccharolyticus JOP 1030-1 TaxID=1450539 RepID=A0A318YZU5_9EURO|nr:NAD dependent epimerase/dehydratase [Aspergillus saccharolyticus JOP 1030-1]PYH40236.1 NAD dependent epimerase/dehydratase [Aspergillus saccharolyticus JOP 1030-1]
MNQTMPPALIFLTGATGLIGFRILVLCLQHGHRVRVALRTLSAKHRILNTPSIKSLSTTNPTLTTTHLTFTEIPDLTLPSAFYPNPALQDVTHIIHAAAPIASADPASIGQNLEAHYIHPTINTCLNLLSSARAQCSIKRIILTSSLAALIDHAEDTVDKVHAATTRAVNVQAPPYSSPSEAYIAAKVGALKRVEDWVRWEKPAFDVVHLAPGHVFGVNELVDDPRELLGAGSNRIILRAVVESGSRFESSLQIQTQTAPAPAPEPGVTVHLDDVAEAHVRALNPSIPGNRLYILSSGREMGTQLDECFGVVARWFPEAVERRVLRGKGSLPSSVFRVDAQESAKVLGMEFRGFEEQVRDVVAYYLLCLERRGGDCTAGIGG